MINIILITITIIVLIIATITDIKTHEIPDYLTYSLIFTGLAIKTIYSLISNNFNYLLYGTIGLTSMYLIGSLLYYTKQIGGGDVKLLTGLGLTLTNPLSTQLPFLLILFLNIAIIGTIYSITIGTILAIKNWKPFIHQLKNLFKVKLFKKLELILFVTSLILPLSIFFTQENKLKILFLLIFILINLYIPFWLIAKAIELTCMHKYILTKHLREGDWLIKPVIKNRKILIKPKTTGLTKEDINLLIKNKIKKVLIKKGIPFVPAITLATILTLIYPKIFFFLLT